MWREVKIRKDGYFTMTNKAFVIILIHDTKKSLYRGNDTKNRIQEGGGEEIKAGLYQHLGEEAG
jgi:hypothetical protein